MFGFSPFIIALIGTVLYALARGERDERQTAIALVVAVVASVPGTAFWSKVELWIWAVDTALLGFLLWVAIRSAKFWPLWAAGFQIPSVTTHLAMLVQPVTKAWAYATAGIIWNILVLAALATGTYFEVVRSKKRRAEPLSVWLRWLDNP